MQYQVFVQSSAEQRFVASIVGMPTITGEGTTEETAIAQAKAELQAQLARGKFVTIQVGETNQSGNCSGGWIRELRKKKGADRLTG